MKLKATIFLVIAVGFSFSSDAHFLTHNYYQNTCPQAEDVIAKTMADMVHQDFQVAPRILRLHFHDCFVRGCDASVLLDSTATNKAEKEAPQNNPSLKGFDIIDRIKETLEQQCPNVVSCADIIAYAARESVHLTGRFERYNVRGGRKDGLISSCSEALTNLPPNFGDVNLLMNIFASKGLTPEEMVTLSGAHSIGNSFCSVISARYTNFNSTGRPDPALNPELAEALRRQCGDVSTVNNIVPMDTCTPTLLDNKYYNGLIQNKGLFTSDATLITDERTLKEVVTNAAQPVVWGNKFVDAMIKMGEIEVLTGTQGEIRRKCSLVN